MGTITDKVVGKTKQIVAEVTGDGKLAEEGKEQVKQGQQEPAMLCARISCNNMTTFGQ
jgi:uncharacterized protein YjbJ (UPF0337 family)